MNKYLWARTIDSHEARLGGAGGGRALTVRSLREHIEPVLRGHGAKRAVDVARKATCDHQRESRRLIPLLDQHVDMTAYALRACSRGKRAPMEIQWTALRQRVGRARSCKRPSDAACGNVEKRAA